ncbi:zonular occludens toxin domain-containing protein [Stenotrophomonas maltophilia]|uniref:zonular occludens toxin domain-containing protein n=1 Tax=Stenotrophomonas maltophilia TaxID=40324 RepID=UPI0015F5CC56|nr:zonular occludens toxin domain-containing protein [Stenotrophomonas maltophilia]
MLYQYTGQPGHGKTVLAIESALEMKAKADKQHESDPKKHPLRELYVCNVRDFNHGACGALDLTPQELMNWHDDARFDNAIILVDEAYEHGMFSRRPPGRPVPEHVKQVAKHRHRGIDFIMICQSPKKQMDDFLHDLIEEHYHIRRRFGLPFVHVKRWDKFEEKPDKAVPLTTKRRGYPKHVFKLYTSTKYDTSEKRVPWFYWAAIGIAVFTAFSFWQSYGQMRNRFFGSPEPQEEAAKRMRADGVPATAAKPAAQAASRPKDRGTTSDYVESLMPRIAAQPWSAPIYDAALSVPAEPPRLFCMAAGEGTDAMGERQGESCTCVTEQGTRYTVTFDTCTMIARHGQYEPYRKPDRSSGALGQPSVPQQPAAPPPGIAGTAISRGNRSMGTFPESPAFESGTSMTIGTVPTQL